MSVAYHVSQARMLAHALAEQAAVETLLPIKKANVLITSLRLIRRELDAALADLEQADRREVRRAVL
jgi:hypothetical protein